MHPQPRVRFVVLVCTRVFTAEAPETSGIPHAMVLRLIRDLPGDEFLFATVISRIEWLHVPGWAAKTSAGLSISNGCQDHTTSPYASMPLVLRADHRSRGLESPPCDINCTRNIIASTASRTQRS